MVKIKQKKTMNLPQLIEWAWDNDITNKEYICDGFEIKSVVFSLMGWAEFNNDFSYSSDNTFTVEVEEEITEDTVIPKLLTTFKKTHLKDEFGYQRVRIDKNYPIKLMLNKAEAHGEPIETLHIVNDDGTHTLIWRDGKLVE
ncbi:hypothetical protein [Staphylococcus sp. GDY8P199P]|uniref:hypothetical protein n=1 Tax=Staphylococcus sp. GDY8P199P TaxID=2804175 RepID=UPI001AEBFF36|nr:hypothetical protein [Staphylococcus sp. GDY8P199P]